MASPKPAAAPPPAPAAAPAPPPGAGRTALAPTIVPMPEGTVDPAKALNERQAASLAKIATARRTAEGDDREGPPTPPKESKSASPASKEPASGKSGKETPAAGSPPTSETAPKPKVALPTDSSGTETEPPKELRYDEKSLTRWAEKNPEAAKAWAEKQFKKVVDEDWVKFSHKKRRLREDVQERSAAGIAAAEEKLAQALREKSIVDDAVTKLSPVADLWEATGGRAGAGHPIDFDAAEAAFEANSGMKLDDFMRARARRGIVNPEMARQKAENARLKRELEAAKKPAEAKAEEPEAKPEPKAKVVPDRKAPDWTEDIEKKHGLRKFTGWEGELAEAMAKHYDEDLDEYGADVEVVADKLLKKKLAELSGVEEPEAPTPRRAKRAPADAPRFDPSKVKVKETDDVEDDDDSDADLIKNVKGPSDPQARMRWAMQRAAARARQPGLE